MKGDGCLWIVVGICGHSWVMVTGCHWLLLNVVVFIVGGVVSFDVVIVVVLMVGSKGKERFRRPLCQLKLRQKRLSSAEPFPP